MADLNIVSVKDKSGDGTNELCKTALANLNIFITGDDKTSTDITKMSDFFGIYIKNSSLAIRENSKSETVMNVPSSMIGSFKRVRSRSKYVGGRRNNIYSRF